MGYVMDVLEAGQQAKPTRGQMSKCQRVHLRVDIWSEKLIIIIFSALALKTVGLILMSVNMPNLKWNTESWNN